MSLSFLRPRRRYRSAALAVTAVVGINAWVVVPYVGDQIHNHTVDSASYKAEYGHWDTVNLPKGLRVNAVHASLLDTGKILITAGSGNDAGQFAAGTFKTLLYDPATGKSQLVYTPSDLFCSGQVHLTDGSILFAGGTQRYEVLAKNVVNAGGVMTVRNESPSTGLRLLPKNTEFVAANGQKYKTDSDLIVQPAAKKIGPGGAVTVIASSTTVWVDAETKGAAALVHTVKPAHFTIAGESPLDSRNIYGVATDINMNKQDFQGASFSYVFDPATEQYTRVPDLTTKRWYPTLTPLSDGSVLAVSGLDGTGQIVQGSKETEQWVPSLGKWVARPDLSHYFPTYPALYQTSDPDVLFYSSGNSGYGLGSKGRQPGLWNIKTNAFTPVPGLRDAADNETSGSAWVGPVQNQTMAVVGGGGVGESTASTGRIDIVNLASASPRFTPGPSLPKGTRYPGLVTLPDDTLLITGGSQYYRGEHASDNHVARIYHPTTNTLTVAANPTVGRDYHSEALLLPDGRVLTMGGNPLFSDKKDTITAKFEQRLAIYTPAYLYHGPRPVVTSATASAPAGGTLTVTSADAAGIVSARLIRPASVTHQLNVEQGSIALGLTHTEGGLTLTVPSNGAIAPPGGYMLFLVNSAGVPSVAKWVTISS